MGERGRLSANSASAKSVSDDDARATVEGLSDVLSHLLPYNNVEERGLFLPLLSLLVLPATIDGD